MENQSQSYMSGSGCLVRSLWSFIGHAVLLVLLMFVFEKHARCFSIYDGLYLLTIVLIILARFIDIRFLKGETVYGQPATTEHLRRHILVMAPVYLLLLILAHVFGVLF
jgi:hypothetical protein